MYSEAYKPYNRYVNYNNNSSSVNSRSSVREDGGSRSSSVSDVDVAYTSDSVKYDQHHYNNGLNNLLNLRPLACIATNDLSSTVKSSAYNLTLSFNVGLYDSNDVVRSDNSSSSYDGVTSDISSNDNNNSVINRIVNSLKNSDNMMFISFSYKNNNHFITTKIPSSDHYQNRHHYQSHDDREGNDDDDDSRSQFLPSIFLSTINGIQTTKIAIINFRNTSLYNIYDQSHWMIIRQTRQLVELNVMDSDRIHDRMMIDVKSNKDIHIYSILMNIHLKGDSKIDINNDDGTDHDTIMIGILLYDDYYGDHDLYHNGNARERRSRSSSSSRSTENASEHNIMKYASEHFIRYIKDEAMCLRTAGASFVFFISLQLYTAGNSSSRSGYSGTTDGSSSSSRSSGTSSSSNKSSSNNNSDVELFNISYIASKINGYVDMTLFSKSNDNNYDDSIGIDSRDGNRAEGDCVGRWFTKDNNRVMSRIYRNNEVNSITIQKSSRGISIKNERVRV
jgi:hypothetical protein